MAMDERQRKSGRSGTAGTIVSGIGRIAPFGKPGTGFRYAAFVPRSRHGKDIAPCSAHPAEKEVLFAAGTRFRVLDAQRRGSDVIIELQEIE